VAGEVRRAGERGIGANVGGEDSKRGTWGQLVGGTVWVQVAGFFKIETFVAPLFLAPNEQESSMGRRS
jgi:hypothetical protein